MFEKKSQRNVLFSHEHHFNFPCQCIIYLWLKYEILHSQCQICTSVFIQWFHTIGWSTGRSFSLYTVSQKKVPFVIFHIFAKY